MLLLFLRRSLRPGLTLRLGLSLFLAVVLSCCGKGTGTAEAAMIGYNVSFNTPGQPTQYTFDPATTYGLDFFLSGSGGTTITGSNFSGSGTSPANNFTLNNTGGQAGTTSAFTPVTGGSLSFDIFADYASTSTDTFSFAIRKGYTSTAAGSIIRTNEPAVFESFFKIDFSSASGPVTSVYSSNDPNPNIQIGAPSVSAIAAVPEPSTYAMMLLGVGALGLAMRRKRRARPEAEFTALAI